uniref:Agmatinase n=1 Tax=Ciona savignyi TaxID=51511 RepID=H2YD35_CIOSA
AVKKLNVPLSGKDMARCGGITSMMRLPIASSLDGLDACFVGVPIDIGVSNRPGARYSFFPGNYRRMITIRQSPFLSPRQLPPANPSKQSPQFGPREIRNQSVVVHEYNVATGAAPFQHLMVADVGDVWVNLYNLPDICWSIRESFSKIIKNGCVPITAGGDHTITYPILQAVAAKHGPVGLVHVDAHGDCADLMLGEKIAHGTSFRRAVEEGLLDTKRVVQIGLRGSDYFGENNKFQRDNGFRIIPATECWHKSLTPLMHEVRQQMGDRP